MPLQHMILSEDAGCNWEAFSCHWSPYSHLISAYWLSYSVEGMRQAYLNHFLFLQDSPFTYFFFTFQEHPRNTSSKTSSALISLRNVSEFLLLPSHGTDSDIFNIGDGNGTNSRTHGGSHLANGCHSGCCKAHNHHSRHGSGAHRRARSRPGLAGLLHWKCSPACCIQCGARPSFLDAYVGYFNGPSTSISFLRGFAAGSCHFRLDTIMESCERWKCCGWIVEDDNPL